MCGAGSDEVLALLARAYSGTGDEVLFGEHAFVTHPLFALSIRATPVGAPETEFTVSVDALLSRVSDKTRIVYVANPNNPTGTMVTSDEMTRLRAGLRDDILLVNSAYAEYVTRNDYAPGVELVDAGDNVVMTRTFSKIYAMGGEAQLGILSGSRGRRAQSHTSPFNVTSGAQAAGIAAVNDIEFLTRSRDHNTAWLPWLSDRLGEMGLDVVPSSGNSYWSGFRKADPTQPMRQWRF